MKIDKHEALQVAQKAAILGKEILWKHFGHLNFITEKERAGLVSEADRESEEIIKKTLLAHFPDIPILGEESGLTGSCATLPKSSKTLWIIDPLDGTHNYIFQFPYFSISIGLMVDSKMYVGLIDFPSQNQTFSAMVGEGSYKNNVKISVAKRAKLKDTLVATGFPSHRFEDKLKKAMNIYSEVLPQVVGIRQVGSAALDLCMVAQGVFDAYWEQDLSPWDTAAGSLIVQEAGGVVSSYRGEAFDPFMDSILAGSAVIHPSLLEKIAKSLSKK